MPNLPVMLKVDGKLAVVVGGGAAARRRAATLVECGARVRMIAPDAEFEGVEVRRRTYRPGDVEGAFLVVIATDDPVVNESVAREAAGGGALVNRADDAEEGDLSVMAHHRRGLITVAVSTGGISATAAAAIRDELIEKLDAKWIELLELVAPFRSELRAIRDTGKRQAALRRLTNHEALRALRSGGAKAVREYCQTIVEESGR